MRSLSTVFILLFMSLAVRADHEPHHRYEVQGYILDANRQPLPGTGLSLNRGNQILGSTHSDSDGFYYMKLHLHDSSIGLPLKLVTSEYSGTITMTADASDTSTRRLHYANFIGGKLVEGELQGMGSARWVYYAGAALALALITAVVATGVKKRRKRRRRQAQNPVQGQRHGKRQGKGKGKQRRKQ